MCYIEIRRCNMGEYFTILHQPSHSTKFDKYPELFRKAVDLVQIPPSKILSFGCSSGEECYTLRKYFPNSEVVGCEIDQILVNQCKVCNTDPGVQFIHSRFDLLKKFSPYNLIFALNVFVRDVKHPDLYPLYLFSYFEDQIEQFDQILSSDGIIVICNSQHDLKKTRFYKEGKYQMMCHDQFAPNFYQKISQ